MSEDFCLPFGAWTVKINVAPNGTHPEMAPYGNATYYFSDRTCAERGACRGSEAITYEPVLDYAWCHFGRDLANPAMHLPFRYLLGDFLVRVARGGGNGEQGLGIWPELP